MGHRTQAGGGGGARESDAARAQCMGQAPRYASCRAWSLPAHARLSTTP